MPVLIEKPRSFDVEKFLLAISKAKKLNLSLINPDSGQEIYHRLVNIPIIGLTFKPTPDHDAPLGFLPKLDCGDKEEQTDEDDPSRPTFSPEALLVLDVDPKDLPEKVDYAWVLQVEDKRDEKAYVEIADLLSTQFNETIIVSSAHMDNPDPDVVDGQPSNPKFPGSAPFCPIVIRRTDPA